MTALRKSSLSDVKNSRPIPVKHRCLLHPNFCNCRADASGECVFVGLGDRVPDNTLRSVTSSVSLSFPEPADRWERTSHVSRFYPVEGLTGTGSRWCSVTLSFLLTFSVCITTQISVVHTHREYGLELWWPMCGRVCILCVRPPHPTNQFASSRSVYLWITTVILLHSKHTYLPPNRCLQGNSTFCHKKPG